MATKATIYRAPSPLRLARDGPTDGEYLSSSEDSDGSVGGDGGGGRGGARCVRGNIGNSAAGQMEDERAGGGRGGRGRGALSRRRV